MVYTFKSISTKLYIYIYLNVVRLCSAETLCVVIPLGKMSFITFSHPSMSTRPKILESGSPIADTIFPTYPHNNRKTLQTFPHSIMAIRPKLKKVVAPLPTPSAESYRLRPILDPTAKRRNKSDVPLVVFPNGEILTQNSTLARLPGQVGFMGDRPVTLDDIAHAVDSADVAQTHDLTQETYFHESELNSPSKHRLKRMKQSHVWTSDVIPGLIDTYLELQRKTRMLRDEPMLKVEKIRCECCPQSRLLRIWVVQFSSAWFPYQSLSKYLF